MKILVTYFSQTGNTRKVAETIYNEIECEKEIYAMKDVNSLDGYDLIFAGFPVLRFEPASQAAEFLYKHAAGKNIAIFVTHASPYESEIDNEQKIYESMLRKCRDCAINSNFAGFFHCRGKITESYNDSEIGPVLQQYSKRGNDTSGHPDEGELEVAKIFTRDVITRFSSLVKNV